VRDAPAIPNDRKLQILEELSHVLDTGFRDASDRQRSLLRYLVMEEIEGRGVRIKAYGIATEVLGRGAEFDAQLDSIVRVEVGRLRQALERHYLTEGAGAALMITIPKGQYRPVFVDAPKPAPALVQTAPRPGLGRLPVIALALAAALMLASALYVALAPAARPGSARGRAPLVAIAAPDFSSDSGDNNFFAAGLQSELAAMLSEFNWLAVVPLEPAASGVGKADFIVRGSVQATGARLATTVLLLEGASGAVLWTKRYDVAFHADAIIEMERSIARQVAMDVGHPFGVLMSLVRTALTTQTLETEEAFACKMRAMHYWSTRKRAHYGPARACLDKLRGAAPPDADALAALSLLLLDGSATLPDRAAFEQARTDASALADAAYEVDEVHFLPRVAKYTAALCAGDVQSFRLLARALAADYPNNPLALEDVGAKLALGANDREEGLALIERARALSSNLLPADVVAVAGAALAQGQGPDLKPLRDAALREETPAPALLYLAGAGARNEAAAARAAVARLRELGLSDGDAMREHLRVTCLSDETHDAIVRRLDDGLRLAAGE
jgi:adenylate cyclase